MTKLMLWYVVMQGRRVPGTSGSVLLEKGLQRILHGFMSMYMATHQ